MPSDDSFWLHDGKNICPSRPHPPQRAPEEPIEARQWRPWSLAFEYGDLLPQGKDLERGIHATAEEGAERADERRDEIEHESPVVARGNRRSSGMQT